MTELSARQVFTHPVHLLAYGFGAGLSPKAPGTMGTLAAIPLYIGLSQLEPWLYTTATLAAFDAGVFICGYTARRLGVEDPKSVVWDEVVGFFISMAFVPFGLVWIAAGFVVFRLLDILKPWPIRWLDRHVKGGFGIMLDDAVAALPVCVLLNLSAHFIRV